jgi:Tfp pilus assembly protein PilO
VQTSIPRNDQYFNILTSLLWDWILKLLSWSLVFWLVIFFLVFVATSVLVFALFWHSCLSSCSAQLQMSIRKKHTLKHFKKNERQCMVYPSLQASVLYLCLVMGREMVINQIE